MTTAVCGSKRSFFEDVPPSPSSLSKRVRRSSSISPTRFSPPPPPPPLHQLRSLFPRLETEVLERALHECGNDLELAINRTRELCQQFDECSNATVGQGVSEGINAVSENSVDPHVISTDVTEWVNFFVTEMTSAVSIDDARVRATRMLGFFQKSIVGSNGVEATQTLQKENLLLKQQLDIVFKENTILKHGVAIQHERLKQQEDKTHELHNLKQLITQYQEQLRTLEMNNYALKIHLKQAEQSSSIPGRFRPDVF